MTPQGLRLQQPIARREDGRLTISCDLDGAPALWVIHEGPATILDRIEPRIEPFVPVALLLAGAVGRDLVIDTPADPAFLTTLRLAYVPLLAATLGFPGTRMRLVGEPAGRRAPRVGTSSGPTPPPEPAALLFSGGIDSFYSLTRLRAVGHPLSLLVNVNAGAHGRDRAVWRQRLARVRRAASESGLGLVTIDTDFHELLEVPHLQAHQFRNLPAAYTLHGASRGLMFSTAISMKETGSDWPREGLEVAGAAIARSIAWNRMPVTEIGYETSRFEKLAVIADEPLTYHALDVCVDARYQAAAGPSDPANCSRCYKCARTMLSLDLLGRLDRYGTQFDLQHYAADREALLGILLRRRGLNDLEVIARLEGRPRPEGALVTVTRPAWAGPADP